MGNIQNREAIEKTNHIVNEIMKYDCCLLEIGIEGGKPVILTLLLKICWKDMM
jgi:hypothetical protein